MGSAYGELKITKATPEAVQAFKPILQNKITKKERQIAKLERQIAAF